MGLGFCLGLTNSTVLSGSLELGWASRKLVINGFSYAAAGHQALTGSDLYLGRLVPGTVARKGRPDHLYLSLQQQRELRGMAGTSPALLKSDPAVGLSSFTSEPCTLGPVSISEQMPSCKQYLGNNIMRRDHFRHLRPSRDKPIRP